MSDVFIDLDRMEESFNSARTFSTVTISDVAPNIHSKFIGNDVSVSFVTETVNPLEMVVDAWEKTPMIVKGIGVLLTAGILMNFVYPLLKSKR